MARLGKKRGGGRGVVRPAKHISLGHGNRRVMTTRRAAFGVAALAALALLAGCIGADTLGGDDGGDDGPSGVHDAPRPAFLEDGAVADGDELFRATDALLRNRSHGVHLVNTTLVPDAEGRFRAGRMVQLERRVGSDGAVLARHEVVDARGAAVRQWNASYYLPAGAGHATGNATGSAGGNASVWVWRNASIVDREPLADAPRIVDRSPIPFRGRLATVRVTEIERLRDIAAGDAFQVGLSVATEDGVGFGGQAVVGSDGVVYGLRLEERRAASDDRMVSWRLRDVDAASVDRPVWLEEAQVNASDDTDAAGSP
jgi:hypothetical protein